MAVSLYCGTPGSGKSYEVVAFVILPALAKGRRVVTNIAGFDEFAARDYLMQKDKVAPSQIGSIVLVDDDEVTKPGFFPVIGRDNETVVKGGDLVVIDEAWKFWGADSAVGDEALEFFRKHRHLTHDETGVSCDLVVIAQEPSSLHRKVRGVVELSFKAKKLKSLGLNGSYTVHMWEGPNQRRKAISIQTRRYNKAIFPLYSSYSGSNGVAGCEMVVDDRQNVFKRPSFWLISVVVVVLFVSGIFKASAFFSGNQAAGDRPEVASKSAAAGTDIPAVNVAPERFGHTASNRLATRSGPNLSKEWRLAGYLSVRGKAKVLLIDGAGRIRFEAPGSFAFVDGKPTSGVVDGERVTPWSGVPVGSGAVTAPARNLMAGFSDG